MVMPPSGLKIFDSMELMLLVGYAPFSNKQNTIFTHKKLLMSIPVSH